MVVSFFPHSSSKGLLTSAMSKESGGAEKDTLYRSWASEISKSSRGEKTSPPHKAEGQFRPRLVNKMGRETEEQFLPGQEQEALREVRGSQPDNAGMSDPRGPPGTSCVLTQSL